MSILWRGGGLGSAAVYQVGREGGRGGLVQGCGWEGEEGVSLLLSSALHGCYTNLLFSEGGGGMSALPPPPPPPPPHTHPNVPPPLSICCCWSIFTCNSSSLLNDDDEAAAKKDGGETWMGKLDFSCFC